MRSKVVLISFNLLVLLCGVTTIWPQAPEPRVGKNPPLQRKVIYVFVRSNSEPVKHKVSQLLRLDKGIQVVDDLKKAEFLIDVSHVYHFYERDLPQNFERDLPKLDRSSSEGQVVRKELIRTTTRVKTSITVFALSSGSGAKRVWRKSESWRVSDAPATPRTASNAFDIDPLPPRTFEEKDNISVLIRKLLRDFPSIT